MKNVYHIAQTPEGTHVHGPLDPALDALTAEIMKAQPGLGEDAAWALALGEVVGRIRDSLGFPDGFAATPDSEWASHVAPGEPHPTLMNRATVHAELP